MNYDKGPTEVTGQSEVTGVPKRADNKGREYHLAQHRERRKVRLHTYLGRAKSTKVKKTPPPKVTKRDRDRARLAARIEAELDRKDQTRASRAASRETARRLVEDVKAISEGLVEVPFNDTIEFVTGPEFEIPTSNVDSIVLEETHHKDEGINPSAEQILDDVAALVRDPTPIDVADPDPVC